MNDIFKDLKVIVMTIGLGLFYSMTLNGTYVGLAIINCTINIRS